MDALLQIELRKNSDSNKLYSKAQVIAENTRLSYQDIAITEGGFSTCSNGHVLKLTVVGPNAGRIKQFNTALCNQLAINGLTNGAVKTDEWLVKNDSRRRTQKYWWQFWK